MNEKKEIKKEKEEIVLSTDTETLRGVYCNMARITHNKNEFIMDFILKSTTGDSHLVSRVITSPDHFEKLCDAFQNNLKKYKDKFDDG